MSALPAKDENLYVVGIGASAGGLPALRTLFGCMPPDPGYACVVVMHLAPDHDSHLVELLQPYTSLPVQQVHETVRLKANQVYVIPPNANLSSIDSHLRLSPLEARRIDRSTIDHFMRTLAGTHDGRSVGVVLTGAGSDGALGIRQIKEGGGLTIAQDPAEAEYDSMPHNAIATGTVDLVLPLRKIPDEIARYCGTQPLLPAPGHDPIAAMDDVRRGIRQVVEVLQEHTRHDFSMYREAPLLRRVRHRMQLRHVDVLAAYVEVLRAEPAEAHSLKRDLQLHVTEFFQDAALYQLLEARVLPDIFAQEPQLVRVWSIGCSTGEEAYSLAMLLIEQSERASNMGELQVFASDVSDDALRRARRALYPHEVSGTVSLERLQRFFVSDGEQFRVSQDVRERVVFAEHNLFKDPPYSHLDLIMCRNLLAELQPEVRVALFNLFFYALAEGGILIVGGEDEMNCPELFAVDERYPRILHRRPGMRRDLLSSSWSRLRPYGAAAAARAMLGGFNKTTDEVYRSAIERYAPPTVAIDANGTVLRFSSRANRFIRMPGGDFTSHLADMLQPATRARLEIGLAEVRASGAAWASDPFVEEADGDTQRQIVLRVDPLERVGADACFLVVFDERSMGGATQEPAAMAANTPGLEAELGRMSALLGGLLSGVDEQPRWREVHTSLSAMLEQLEASREEMRTVNEGLAALDAENRGRIAELAQTSNDLSNILESTCVATIVLDGRLRLLRFTEPAARLLQLTERDVGRHLRELQHTPRYDDIVEEAARVFAHETRVDREVAGADGRWYLSRMLPYRVQGGGVDGVVISFIDISDRKRAEAALRESEERQRLMAELVPALLWWVDPVGKEVAVNLQWKSYTGQTTADAQDFGWLAVIHPDELTAIRQAVDHSLAIGEPFERQTRIRDVHGDYRWHLLRQVPIRDRKGAITRWFGAATDIDESHQFQDRQQVLVAELQHRTRNLVTVIRALSERTLNNSPTLEAFRDKFNLRLAALARVQGLLAHLSTGERLTFDDLLGAEIVALGAPDGKVTLEGPPGVQLRSVSVQTLALAIHELATNAVKYGALSPAGGHLHIRWYIEPTTATAAMLHVEWRESGVAMPAGSEAARGSGYGRELILNALPYQLGARTAFTLGPDGVRCTIAVPVPVAATKVAAAS